MVIGASLKPYRYSHTAVTMLQRFGHPVIAIGLKEGKIGDVSILKDKPATDDVHTISLYIGPTRQPEYYNYILNTVKPERIIFNPGTENTELAKKAGDRGIKALNRCTLMMLSGGEF